MILHRNLKFMTKKILTPHGRQKLQAELEKLKEKRKEVVQKIKDAKELGDLSENAEYHAAKEEQGLIEARVNEIESLLKVAMVIKPSTSKNKVNLGSKLKLKSDAGVIDYEIVGMNEADPSHGKISANSPLGEALIGAKKDETVEFNAPAGKLKFTIININ